MADANGSQVIVRRRGLTMTVRIFGADTVDSLGTHRHHHQCHHHCLHHRHHCHHHNTGLRPRGRLVRGGRSYSMCVERGEVRWQHFLILVASFPFSSLPSCLFASFPLCLLVSLPLFLFAALKTSRSRPPSTRRPGAVPKIWNNANCKSTTNQN